LPQREEPQAKPIKWGAYDAEGQLFDNNLGPWRNKIAFFRIVAPTADQKAIVVAYGRDDADEVIYPGFQQIEKTFRLRTPGK